MSWRILTVQNAAQLNLKNKQLVIKHEEGIFDIPIEDLCTIILDSPRICLTSKLLGYLHQHNVVVITCDERHLPNGLLHGFHQHSRQTEISHIQRIVALPLQKRIWQRIIQEKILNQARCLKRLNHSEAQFIFTLAQKVESGDKGNMEAYVARLYWPFLYGPLFRRHDCCLANSALNYGYAILRSVVCRAIVAYGLIPSYGIHHKNELNPFNLADDLLEPYRPLIDLFVKNLIRETNKDNKLPKEIRKELVNVAFLECKIKNEIRTLHNAVEKTCSSFVVALKNKAPNLVELPEVIV